VKRMIMTAKGHRLVFVKERWDFRFLKGHIRGQNLREWSKFSRKLSLYVYSEQFLRKAQNRFFNNTVTTVDLVWIDTLNVTGSCLYTVYT
jgi:hypothetical protein